MVEMMIVSALIAILLSLAVPSYKGLKLRSHRSEAISTLLQVAGCHERRRAATGMYNMQLCLPAENQHYSYRFEPSSSTGTITFIAFAEPMAAQLADHCGAMILDQDGHRDVGNSDANANRCWSGR